MEGKEIITNAIDEQKLLDFQLENPNCFELGALIRKEINNIELNKYYPNDYELGLVINKLNNKNLL